MKVALLGAGVGKRLDGSGKAAIGVPLCALGVRWSFGRHLQRAGSPP